jgi:hydrogenase maturation protein HypF
MPGGAAAIRQPWRMAAAYLDDLATSGSAGWASPVGSVGWASPVGSAGRTGPVGSAGSTSPAGSPGRTSRSGLAAVPEVASLAVARRNAARWDPIVAIARHRVNAPLTSSAGRLFDAAAAILGVRDEISYEGQAAIELEQLADPAETGAYQAAITLPGSGTTGTGSTRAAAADPAAADPAGEPAGGPFRASGADLIGAAVADLVAGVPREIIAARFHNGLAALIQDGCVLLREQHGLNTVALSGGVFQNLLLLRQTVARLQACGFTVLTHSRIPCNDGGISLGQAVGEAARDRPLPSKFGSGYLS